jgi:hypothetical protein
MHGRAGKEQAGEREGGMEELREEWKRRSAWGKRRGREMTRVRAGG